MQIVLKGRVLCLKSEDATLSTGKFVHELPGVLVGDPLAGEQYRAACADLGENLLRILRGRHPANAGFTEIPGPRMTYPEVLGFSTENFPL